MSEEEKELVKLMYVCGLDIEWLAEKNPELCNRFMNQDEYRQMIRRVMNNLHISWGDGRLPYDTLNRWIYNQSKTKLSKKLTVVEMLKKMIADREIKREELLKRYGVEKTYILPSFNPYD